MARPWTTSIRKRCGGAVRRLPADGDHAAGDRSRRQAPSAMPTQRGAPARAADPQRDAQPGHRRHEDVEGGQPDHEELAISCATQVGDAVGERVTPPLVGGAGDPEARPDDGREHARRSTRNVTASTSITGTGPPQATRTPPTGAPSSLIRRLLIWFQPWTVPRSSPATTSRTRMAPGRHGQSGGDAEAHRDREQEQVRRAARRPSRRRRAPGRSAWATWPATSSTRGSCRSASTPPSSTSSCLGQHLGAEHESGDAGGEGVHRRPGQGHAPGVVAEPRDADRHQPGEHHRVAADRRRRRPDQLRRRGRGGHGRTGSLGKARATARTGRRTASGCACLVGDAGGVPGGDASGSAGRRARRAARPWRR